MTILIHEELVNTTIACGSALRAEKWDGSACCDKINNRCCVSGLQKCWSNVEKMYAHSSRIVYQSYNARSSMRGVVEQRKNTQNHKQAFLYKYF